ncbi:MAG: hypothetical protein E6767_18790 [Dysgonomonas sp.]|nr:hypothetical protein [Dysgonomonas sp.]
MSRSLSQTDIHANIEWHEYMITQLTGPGNLSAWSFYIGRLHALYIKLALMEGERPVVITYKSDYII